MSALNAGNNDVSNPEDDANPPSLIPFPVTDAMDERQVFIIGDTSDIGRPIRSTNDRAQIHTSLEPSQNASHVDLESQSQLSRRWRMANVISPDHRRFLSNLNLHRELDRLASFAGWRVTRSNVLPDALARTGFFYLGDMDRTQCFSCGGVLRNWENEDDAVDEHRAHFPSCKMVLGTEERNYPVNEYPDTPAERARDYPCRFPSNPHMRSEAGREETFDCRWPTGKTAATSAEIAQAGFFFLGERDHAKCWYCNGGLQNWDYDDMPWVEHAKWFPTCQFLLSVKGQHFVHRHLSANPHLARSIIAKQDGATMDPVGAGGSGRSVDVPLVPPPGPRANQPKTAPVDVNPQAEMRKLKEKVKAVMEKSELVKNVLLMGFDEKIVQALLEEKIKGGNVSNHDDIYDSMSNLLDDVMKKEEKKEEQEERMRQASAAAAVAGVNRMGFPYASVYSAMAAPMSSLGPAPDAGKYQVFYIDEYDPDESMDQDMYGNRPGTSNSEVTPPKEVVDSENSRSLQEQLEQIEEERMCKICFSNPADMVFVPCSHMVRCMGCAQALRQCSLRGKKMKKITKTYAS